MLLGGLAAIGAGLVIATATRPPSGEDAFVALPDPDEVPRPEPTPVGRQQPLADRLPPTVTCVAATVPDCTAWVLPSRDDPSSTVVPSRDLVVTEDEGELVAVGLRDGRRRWQVPAGRDRDADTFAYLVPFPQHDLLLRVAADHRGEFELHAVRLSSGHHRWEVDGWGGWPTLWSDGRHVRVHTVDGESPTAQVLRTLDVRTGVTLDEEVGVVAGLGDAHGEVLLTSTTLEARSRIGLGADWTVTLDEDADPSWVDATADVVRVFTPDAYRWYDRASGEELGRRADPWAIVDDDPNGPQLFGEHTLTSGESLEIGPGGADVLSVRVHRFGELLLERELPAPAALETAGGVAAITARALVVRGPTDDEVELIDLATGEVRTIQGVPPGPLWAEDDDLALVGNAARTGSSAGLDLVQARVAWRATGSPLWPVLPSREVLSWPGGLLRLDLDG